MTVVVPAAFDWTRALLDGGLRAAVERLSPEIRPVAGYHLGLVEADGGPAARAAGKAVRPTIVLVAAKAAGAAPEDALDGAVAVELVHDFSLLHDDVMDRDRERRHRATAWVVFGEARAILAGDALLAAALELLLEPPLPERVRAARLLTHATVGLIEGQGADLALEGAVDADLARSLAMCAQKTGALLGCAGALGAVLAGADDELVERLGAFGRHLGLAFQAVDDLLGVWGSPARTGKPVYGDLRRRKASLPVAAALETDAGPELRALLAAPERGEEELARAAALIEDAGGRTRIEALAREELAAALACLEDERLDPEGRRELAELATFVAERDF